MGHIEVEELHLDAFELLIISAKQDILEQRSLYDDLMLELKIS